MARATCNHEGGASKSDRSLIKLIRCWSLSTPSGGLECSEEQLTGAEDGTSRSELEVYRAGIAILSETRFCEHCHLQEVGTGHAFYRSDRHRAKRRDAGVAFAIRRDIAERLPCLPQEIRKSVIA
ncbi:hypothetical protein SprV_0902773900 [Sparganum proliferum]